jgi:hypothetical protein
LDLSDEQYERVSAEDVDDSVSTEDTDAVSDSSDSRNGKSIEQRRSLAFLSETDALRLTYLHTLGKQVPLSRDM